MSKYPKFHETISAILFSSGLAGANIQTSAFSQVSHDFKKAELQKVMRKHLKENIIGGKPVKSLVFLYSAGSNVQIWSNVFLLLTSNQSNVSGSQWSPSK